MAVDGMEFLDWLHRIRRESAAERKRRGISGVEWLKQVEERAAAVEKEIAELAAPIARDKPKSGD
jgi:hypothetical protein